MSTLPAVAAGSELLRRDAVAQHSRKVLLSGQSASGALVASSNFPQYRFSWLRDGSFCAQALDLLGEQAAADAFHFWVARTVLGHADLARDSIRAVRDQTPNPPHLPARFTLDGALETDNGWPNFQLDGYGIWLRALADRSKGAGGAPGVVLDAVRLVADYLTATWTADCNDCWEEPGDGQHTSTLVAVADGLAAATELLADPAYRSEADLVVERVLQRHVHDGRLTKSATFFGVDASLLWLGTSAQLPGHDADALRDRTFAAVTANLVVDGGGLRRYLGDSYFGGGEWLLLTSWLGWQAVRAGDRALSDHCLRWVRAQADQAGDMAEQKTDNPQFPDMVAPWQKRWGPVAKPLLWCHAMDVLHAAAVLESGWSLDG